MGRKLITISFNEKEYFELQQLFSSYEPLRTFLNKGVFSESTAIKLILFNALKELRDTKKREKNS